MPGMFLGRMYLRRWGNRLNTACLSMESQGGEALKSPEIRKLGVKLGAVCGVAGQMDGHCCSAACL